MVIILLVSSVFLLLLLISWLKVNAFLAFLLTTVLCGIGLSMPLPVIIASVNRGIGETLGPILIIVLLGAMLGKLIAQSGAANQISFFLQSVFGRTYLAWALSLTGFLMGIMLYYSVGFMLMVPIIYAAASKNGFPLTYVAIPMLAPLSAMQGLLPPHPAPVLLATQLHANLGLTALYGCIIAVPVTIIAGPLLAKFFAHQQDTGAPVQESSVVVDECIYPSVFNSLCSVLLPVLILVIAYFLAYVANNQRQILTITSYLKEPVMIMIITLMITTYTLGWRTGRSFSSLMSLYGESIPEIAPVLFTIAGAGMLKQIFTDSHLSQEVAGIITLAHTDPLIMTWAICAFLRLCLGSATIASLTACGIIQPVFHAHTHPELLVLALGAGSLFGSHINDTGFWLFKSYFKLDIKSTFMSWTLMESLISILGLAGVLAIEHLLR